MFTLAFDDFGVAEIQHKATSEGCSDEEFLMRAVARFIDKLDSMGDVPRVPNLAREPGWRRTKRFAIELTDLQTEVLHEEARRQGVSLPKLVEHAVIVDLASN